MSVYIRPLWGCHKITYCSLIVCEFHKAVNTILKCFLYRWRCLRSITLRFFWGLNRGFNICLKIFIWDPILLLNILSLVVSHVLLLKMFFWKISGIKMFYFHAKNSNSFMNINMHFTWKFAFPSLLITVSLHFIIGNFSCPNWKSLQST